MNFFRVLQTVTDAETAKAKAAAAAADDEKKPPEVEKPKTKKKAAAKSEPAEEPIVHEDEDLTELPDESGEDGEE